jgi:hypothetical protein
MPAWGSFRPTLEPGAFIQSSVNRLRMRSRPWIGDDSARYEPLLSQAYVLEVLEGPVAGSGYWWYRVRLADWEDLRLRDGKRSGIRSGWVAVADHAGRAWIGGVDVDPGRRQPSLRTGWPVAHRDGLRLRGSTPSLEADGSIVTEATVTGLHPGTALTLIAEGDSETVWRCEPTQAGSNDGDTGTASPITSSARSWADVSVGGDGTGRATLRLLPSPAAVGLCPSGTPVAEVRWTDVHVSDPLHRLELHPKPVSNVPDR